MKTTSQYSLIVWATLLTAGSFAQDVSQPALLQIFETRWETLENRMVDVFYAGYGGLWLPPPSRADSGGLSVGYDVFDRFDLGRPRNETLYGTETRLKSLVAQSHRSGLQVYTDMVLNHNGFRDQSTPGFVASGDYPGFVTTLPTDVDGDFHGRFESGELNFRLAGLIDIAQEKNHQFIRQPVGAHPQNIPSGSVQDVPRTTNARFYPDQGLGGNSVFDPRTNQTVTLYDFNSTDPLLGDAVAENATGLLMRHMRWMVQEVGVDGFRFDAARHMPRWMLDYADQAVFRAKLTPRLDGSPDPVFSFSETGYGSNGFLQDFVRKDIDPANLTVVGGNRDALDFNLFGALKANLTSNGLVNDWRNIKNASFDVNDDGLANNGSQGVGFARSHDEFNAHLDNVAHAYLMMRPGNALVYMNASEFGPPSLRQFPKEGRVDALGGLYGDTLTTLVGIRNTHGRGNYRDRTPASDAKEMLIYEREKSALVVLSNRLDGGFDSRTIATAFRPGTPLIELTGNAEDSVIDPLDEFPSVLIVKPDSTVDLRVPRNVAPGPSGVVHNKGYLIYGVAGPQGRLQLMNSSGDPLTDVLPAGSPTSSTNGTTRLHEITIVNHDRFQIQLQTDAVHLAGAIRDRDADGDNALFRVDGGLDANDLPGVDHVAPGSVAYGFEEFRDLRNPGFFQASGQGLYQQEMDAASLSEGVHYITARAFRHRDPLTGGDGGPAVFTDFRQAIYVDRLPPESAIASFDPYGQPYQRDLMVRSVDQTADSVHIFLNEPAATSDANLVIRAQGGQNHASKIDRDLFVYGFSPVASGNNVASVVTFEATGRVNVQRFAGLFVLTGRGLGLGDLNFDNRYRSDDLYGPGSFEQVLYSQNSLFNPGGDLDADGAITNRDLYLLGPHLVTVGADLPTLDAYRTVLVRRGDVDQSGTTDPTDIDFLFSNLGSNDWYLDLDSNGVVELADVSTLVEDILGTLFGDANLDQVVDGSDFGFWNASKFTSGTGWASGDFNGDGVTDGTDFGIWNSNKFQSGSGGLPRVIPEPACQVMVLAAWVLMWRGGRRPHCERRRISRHGFLTWEILQ